MFLMRLLARIESQISIAQLTLQLAHFYLSFLLLAAFTKEIVCECLRFCASKTRREGRNDEKEKS
jgi:hypothetical protein